MDTYLVDKKKQCQLKSYIYSLVANNVLYAFNANNIINIDVRVP
jgi:hypothetical protein